MIDAPISSDGLAMAPLEPCHDLGVLLVHGIGDQPRGATLVSFGTGLVEWLSRRAGRHGGATVADAVLVPTADNPAHATVRITDGETTRSWLLAEAWWAQSFPAPRFADLAWWGISIVPRTLGSHFGIRLVRAWHEPIPSPFGRVVWMGRVTLRFGSLLGGVLLSLPLLLGLTVLLVLGLIPWQTLRNAIAKLQLGLAASMGDSYILVSRPIESAAIVSHFSRDLAWLESRCRDRRVAIVAHSQGAAVACLAIRLTPPSSNRFLLTFGSGLRKLEELSDLRHRASLRRGAGLTVVGLIFTGVVLALLPGMVMLFRRDLTSLSSFAIVLGYGVVGCALLVAGIRDFVSSDEPSGLRDAAQVIGTRVAGWLDVYATADPVPNGRLHEDRTLDPLTVEVVNYGSTVSDHTTYWQNRDQFVNRVVNALLDFDGHLQRLRLDPQIVEFLHKRRTLRIAFLRAAWWVASVSMVAVVVRYWSEWLMVLAWASSHSVAWIASRFGFVAPIAPRPLWTTVRLSVGSGAVVLAMYGVARWVWSSWNRAEMDDLGQIQRDEGHFLFFLTIIVFQFAVVGIVLTGDVSGWFFFGGFAFMFALMLWPWPTLPVRSTVDEVVADDSVRQNSHADRAAQMLLNTALLLAAVLIMPVGLYLLVRDTRDRLERWWPGRFGWLETIGALIAMLILASVLMGALLHVVRMIKRRRLASTKPG